MTPEERYPHLLYEAAVMADRPDDERIAYIYQDRFIAHPNAQAVLDDLEMLFKMENAVRPQGRLLVGPSLMGKSTILDEFLRKHPADDNVDGDAAVAPVISVQYPESAKEGIYPEILAKLNARMPANTKAPELRRATVELLRTVGMRVLVIDEMHNLLEGSANSQRKGLNSIKYLMNELHRPVIAAGTVEAYNAIRTDEQIHSRLRPIPLSRFHDDQAFQDLLLGFELVLPLRKPSYLGDPELSSIIFEHTLGIVGHVADLLNSAATYAIKKGFEHVSEWYLCRRDYSPSAEEAAAAAAYLRRLRQDVSEKSLSRLLGNRNAVAAMPYRRSKTRPMKEEDLERLIDGVEVAIRSTQKGSRVRLLLERDRAIFWFIRLTQLPENHIRTITISEAIRLGKTLYAEDTNNGKLLGIPSATAGWTFTVT